MSCIYVVFSIFIKNRLIVLHSGSSKLLLYTYCNRKLSLKIPVCISYVVIVLSPSDESQNVLIQDHNNIDVFVLLIKSRLQLFKRWIVLPTG